MTHNDKSFKRASSLQLLFLLEISRVYLPLGRRVVDNFREFPLTATLSGAELAGG